MEKKFDYSEKVRKKLEQETETKKKVLEDKEKEIQDLEEQLCRAKDEAICEYCDFDALLSELGGSFVEGFDDALRQVQKAYPDLDVSHIKINDQGQTSVMPVASESTEDLFGEDVTLGDEESAQAHAIQGQAQPVKGDARDIAENVEDTPRLQ